MLDGSSAKEVLRLGVDVASSTVDVVELGSKRLVLELFKPLCDDRSPSESSFLLLLECFVLRGDDILSTLP